MRIGRWQGLQLGSDVGTQSIKDFAASHGCCNFFYAFASRPSARLGSLSQDDRLFESAADISDHVMLRRSLPKHLPLAVRDPSRGRTPGTMSVA